ncbi:MAG: hypothetical protein HY748_13145 [Elusimicrobia bacterium]|nr:hypothetical protein [Elusimicrobiota bacterium]
MKKLDQAIEKTVDAYGICPKGEGTIQNGDIMKGTKVPWQVKFFDQGETIREVKNAKGYLRYIDVPAAYEEDRAITKDDGFTAVRIAAFRAAAKEGDPSSLAGTLYHEAVHYTRLVTRDSTHAGWKTKEEEEDFALDKKLKAAVILGLSADQIKKTERARADYVEPAREIAAGRRKGTLLFLASIQETRNQEQFMRLKRLKDTVEEETGRLKKRIEARGAVEDLRQFAGEACSRSGSGFFGSDVARFKDALEKSRNLELGLEPFSAFKGLKGCPYQVLFSLFARDVSSPDKLAAAVESGRDVARQYFDGAIAKLQEVARKGCAMPTHIAGWEAEEFGKALSLVYADSPYFGVELYPGTSGLSGCPLTMLRRFLSDGSPYSAKKLNAISDEVVARIRMDMVQEVARVACAKPGELTTGEAEVLFHYLDALFSYSPAYFDLAVNELAGCPHAMLRAFGAKRYQTTMERCVGDFNGVSVEIAGPGGQTPGSGDGGGNQGGTDLERARRRIDQARRELGGLR